MDILAIVDVKESVIFQKCLDSDCRSFRGTKTSIPASIMVPLLHHSREDSMDEFLLSEMEKNPEAWP